MSTKTYIKFYRILSRAYFHLPLLVLFLSNLGYEFKKVIFLMLTYSLTSFIFLVYKKKIINFKNLKLQIYISEILKIIGLLSFIFLNNNFIFLIISQILLSISYSVGIGVDTKIINEKYEDEERKSVQAISNSYMFPSLLISGIIGGVVYSINGIIPFVLSLVGGILIMLITIKNTDKYLVNSENKKEVATETTNYLLLIYYGLSRGIILTLFVSVIPFLLLEKSIVPVSFVLILSFYTFSGYISSKYYLKVKILYGYKILTSLGLIFLGVVFVIYNTIFSIAIGLIFFGLGGGLVRPLTMEKIKSNNDINTMEIIYFSLNIFILVIILVGHK